MQEALNKTYGIVEEIKKDKVDLKAQIAAFLPLDTLGEAAQSLLKPTSEKTLADVLNILRVMNEFLTFRENYRGLEEQEIIVYALCLTLREYKTFSPLCRVGESPLEVFYVWDGKIGVTNLSNRTFDEESLKDRIFHTEARGATIGDASILFSVNR